MKRYYLYSALCIIGIILTFSCNGTILDQGDDFVSSDIVEFNFRGGYYTSATEGFTITNTDIVIMQSAAPKVNGENGALSDGFNLFGRIKEIDANSDFKVTEANEVVSFIITFSQDIPAEANKNKEIATGDEITVTMIKTDVGLTVSAVDVLLLTEQIGFTVQPDMVTPPPPPPPPEPSKMFDFSSVVSVGAVDNVFTVNEPVLLTAFGQLYAALGATPNFSLYKTGTTEVIAIFAFKKNKEPKITAVTTRKIVTNRALLTEAQKTILDLRQYIQSMSTNTKQTKTSPPVHQIELGMAVVRVGDIVHVYWGNKDTSGSINKALFVFSINGVDGKVKFGSITKPTDVDGKWVAP